MYYMDFLNVALHSHVVIVNKSASRKCTPIYKWPDEEKSGLRMIRSWQRLALVARLSHPSKNLCTCTKLTWACMELPVHQAPHPTCHTTQLHSWPPSLLFIRFFHVQDWTSPWMLAGALRRLGMSSTELHSASLGLTNQCLGSNRPGSICPVCLRSQFPPVHPGSCLPCPPDKTIWMPSSFLFPPFALSVLFCS